MKTAPSTPSWLTTLLGPAPPPGDLEEALERAMVSGDTLPDTKKALLYRICVTDFDPTGAHDPSEPPADPSPPAATTPAALSPRTLRVCHRLLAALISDFTPTLFTVGGAHHMACTDALADRWMSDVIAPALADGGVGRPLETLARIGARDWGGAGVCAECVRAKSEEWEGEARAIWGKMDGWIEEAEREENPKT
ncbi:hypothetical protein OF83DRAFT_1127480 [Amylostereum chailletii]|nr:hypothetical protein OF83DRAFT_1127480 [Amylostereum chailletii]